MLFVIGLENPRISGHFLETYVTSGTSRGSDLADRSRSWNLLSASGLPVNVLMIDGATK